MTTVTGQQCANCYQADMQPPPTNHPAYIECPICGAIELTYKPMEHQTAFHETPYIPNEDPNTRDIWPSELQIIGVFGGYGSSKSRASLEEMLFRCLENPGGTGLFCAPTLGQLKKTTLKTWFGEICPPHLIEYFNKADMEIKMVNGFTWYAVPTDDEEKLRSLNVGLVHMEEASGVPRTIFDQLNTRMRDPFTKNRAILVCSNPDIGWIREVLVSNADRKSPTHPEHQDYNPQITTYIWPTHLNRYLPPDFIKNLRKGRPEWWQKRYLDGSFSYSEGMIYPNIAKCFKTTAEVEYFTPDTEPHKQFKRFEKFVTMDWGMRNATAVYLHAIDHITGTVITYQEYYVSGRTVPEHAPHLNEMVETVPAGLLRFMVADPACGNKTDPVNGKSVLSLFAEYGLFFQPGNNHVEAGILKVNSYVERGRWIILTDRCPSLTKELINYKYKEVTLDDGKNPEEKPVKFNDHGADSCRYGFMRLPDDPDLLKTLAFEPPNRYTNARKDPDYTPDNYDEYEDLDFMSIV